MFTKTSISTSLFFILISLAFARCDSNKIKEQEQTDSSNKQLPAKSSKVREPLTKDNYISFLQSLPKEQLQDTFTVYTEFGEIDLVLFENTPLHAANFVHLVNENYFDGTWFHRVSEGHVIQAGNNDDPLTVKKRKAIGEYRIPAEALNENHHFYGALAAARSYRENPEKRSDPYEFYISLGETYSFGQLALMEEKYNITIDPAAKEQYHQIGGSPHLDGEHTVFGKVVKGMEVAAEISKQETDKGEWPLLNIPIKISIKK